MQPIAFGPRVMFEIPILDGIPVTETVVNTWLIMLVLVVLAILGTRTLQLIPKGRQNVAEAVVEVLNNLTRQTMGDDKTGFAPYMGTLFLILIFMNLLGLLGLRPPTADLNTTLALAVITFCMIHYFGARSKGTGTYLKGFAEPFVLLLPMNIMGELATPISLSFRLFGNIVGGLIVLTLAYNGLTSLSTSLGLSAFPILQGGIPVVLHLYFDVFAGVLQSFIFVMLTMVFISIAMD
ncbi:F0F1 ATP synthase subunit A [Anoxynatronum buryatiense]|uniref:ATP synthase subunit a n=1 Tax=Anoxynatronum buryatiense TaxID=489973 RepID=A0AA46AIR9_9CLOT|nr:F0F1 ATP synthase subunit A [Anoxynatronum buryatiense]SMP52342.1 ATP synthase F0 subcomplex A subunit [Anoxynatronum buryatiense]